MMEDSLTYYNRKRRSLRDFIRLSLAFYACLCLLAAIQTAVLYWRGILDTFFSKSLWLLLVNHIGYSAILVLILSFLFNLLENKKYGLGFQVSRVLLIIMVGVETWLTDYFLRYYELAGAGFVDIIAVRTEWEPEIMGILYLLLAIPVFHLSYRLMARSYSLINSMYPFTIVLFSLFITTLVSQKKAVNKNKTQHLLVQFAKENLDMNQYEGNNPYPLFRPHLPAYSLSKHINKGDKLPDIVVLIIEGWGSNFTGEGADYKGFTPFLDSLSQQSLYWENNLSNTGMGYAALPSVVGSMPFGSNGITHGKQVNGQTLPGILEEAGYHTSFYYGGNTAIHHYDRFFTRENIDVIVDNKSFGDDYIKQQEDAAGISLGYPDKELFRRWASDQQKMDHPRLQIIQTLSTATPYHIPNQEAYLAKVDVLAEGFKNTNKYKSIGNNRELFASMLYMDDAIRQFFLHARKNTIYVLTGSHRPRELPVESELAQYRVPLMIYSQDLKSPSKFSNLVSHMDITPSLLGYLHYDYRVKLPDSVAWLGGDLIYSGRFNSGKEIPLIRHRQNISDYIAGHYLVTGSETYNITPGMELVEQDDDELEDHLLEKFRHFRAVNKYVCRNNMLIPSVGKAGKQSFKPSPEELVWIQSVFNGDDFDDAYNTARSLALKGNRERALLLGKYILTQVPGHADTEILMGRVEAWEGRYGPAAEFLEGAVQKYPVYVDAYAALLDLYFWNDKYQKTLSLEKKLMENGIENPELRKKIDKVKQQLRQKSLAEKAVL